LKKSKSNNLRIGLLGGGQLGKMLALAAAKLDLNIWILDKENCPAMTYGRGFSHGDFRKYEDVYQFGKQMDLLTIEIEDVNTEALIDLGKEGKIVHPDPNKLSLIKDKGSQKLYYKERDIPTADFSLHEDQNSILKDVTTDKLKTPFVQKVRTAGYDGRGVCVMHTDDDLTGLLQGPSLVEEKINIKKEIAVIAGRNSSGDTVTFPPVEMEFHAGANLVERLVCPADIPERLRDESCNLAKKLIDELNICGLLAVEFFVTEEEQVLVNEIAPRPHNSGHHTIEGCFPNQYEMHLRAILDMPLYDPVMVSPTVMVNLVGEPDFTGSPVFEGLDKCLSIPGVSVHIYGKKETRPWRKMGHVTIVDSHLERAIEKANLVQQTIKVIS
jgi:5-(carboxyamino)imidazole ribonucleotide synthase